MEKPAARRTTKSTGAKSQKQAPAPRKKAAAAPTRMKNIAAKTPAEYARAVAAFGDWRSRLVASLRQQVASAADVEEVLKWGNLVYLSNGPVLMIRVEDARVLFGFWRGQRLCDLEPRLKPGGKYEMATLELRAGDKPPSSATIKALVRQAVRLNDPSESE